MFITSRNSQFSIKFPSKFIPSEISKKYGNYVNRIPGGLIENTIDILNLSIQSIDIPGPSFDPIEQIDNPGNSRQFRSSLPKTQLLDRTFTISVKTFDGFFNYWMCLELFHYYYGVNDESHIKSMMLHTKDSEGNKMVTIEFMDILYTGLSSLNLDFSSNSIDFNTFEMNFAYNDMKIQTEIK